MLVAKQPANGSVSTLPPAPFVVGASRSGTTLLRLMLDAHPDLAIPPETYFMRQLDEACQGTDSPRQQFIHTLTTHSRWPDFHLDQRALEERLEALTPFTVSDALRAFYTLYADRFDKRRWGDKSPRYSTQMQRIQRLLPESRFIHVIRDGRDVALSIVDLWWGPNSIPEAAGWWISIIQTARDQLATLDHYLEIRYEDLVLDTEVTLRRICAFVDLPWNDEMLSYYERAHERLQELDTSTAPVKDGRVVEANERQGIHTLAHQPPQRERLERWRQAMGHDDRRRFVEIAGELLEELGYAID